MGCNLPGSSVLGIFLAGVLEWVVISSPGDHPDLGIKLESPVASALTGGFFIPSLADLPDPEIELRSPALQVDSLPAEPKGKPKNNEVGSLSLL